MLANLDSHNMRNYTLSIVAMVALLAGLLLSALPLATGLRAPAADVALSPSQALDFGKLPLSFEANEGQTDPSVKYMTHTSGGTMYFTPNEVVLALQSTSERQASNAKGSAGLASLSIPDEASHSAD